MLIELAIYSGLFWNAFIAATLLPAYSEITLLALLAEGTGTPLLLFLTATAGNVLGSIFNWWLGVNIRRFENRKWFPVKQDAISKAEHVFRRYGVWSLLLAWVPIIGDPLTLVAGVLRVRLIYFILLVTISKAARYAVIVLGYHAL